MRSADTNRAGLLDQRKSATRLFDRLLGSLGCGVCLEHERLFHGTAREQFHRTVRADDALHSKILQTVGASGKLGFEGLDVDDFVRLLARRRETAELGLATDERHLATFKPQALALSRARLLPLRSTARRRTATGAATASEALGWSAGAGCGTEFVKHRGRYPTGVKKGRKGIFPIDCSMWKTVNWAIRRL